MDESTPTDVFVLGIIWDRWTSQVESQLVRDVIAMQDETKTWPGQKFAVSCGPEASRVLNALNVTNVGPLSKAATTWRLYQTLEAPPQAPDWAKDTIVQVIFQKKHKTQFRDMSNTEIYLKQFERDVNYDPFSRRPTHPGVAPETPWLVLL